MPYIENYRRIFFEDVLDKMETKLQTVGNLEAGDLNYLITKMCLMYIDIKGKSYRTLNEIHGLLNCANEEFRRRVTNVYEDSKIELNGDVFLNTL